MTDASREHVRARLAQMAPEQRQQLLSAVRSSRTVSALVDPSPWFLRFEAQAQPEQRLFCFSYAGGGASVFRGWHHLIGERIDLCAVQLPGRECRATEPAVRRLEDLLPQLADVIAPLCDVPFAFFGHSMGALVAFELARLLRRRGMAQPAQLLLSAFRAPQLPNPNIRIYHLPDEVLKTVLLKEGTPQEVLRNDELMKVLLPTLRADFELCDTYAYRPETALDIPIHAFGGHQDVRVGREDLQAWDQQAGNTFDLTMLPGSHFFLHSAKHLLVDAVNSTLTTHSYPQGVVA